MGERRGMRIWRWGRGIQSHEGRESGDREGQREREASYSTWEQGGGGERGVEVASSPFSMATATPDSLQQVIMQAIARSMGVACKPTLGI